MIFATISAYRHDGPSSISRAGRGHFQSAVEERLSHKIADALAVYLKQGWIDPFDNLKFFIAEGFWTHRHQDCMRFTGSFSLKGQTHSFGCYGSSLSVLERNGFTICDDRDNDRRLVDFDIEVLTA